eukprot:389328_1
MYFGRMWQLYSACNSVTFDAQHASNVNVQCGGDHFDCHGSTFNVQYADIVIFDMYAYEWYNIIYANNVTTELTINCHDTQTCGYLDLYCPNAVQCTINCLAQKSCIYTDLFIS